MPSRHDRDSIFSHLPPPPHNSCYVHRKLARGRNHGPLWSRLYIHRHQSTVTCRKQNDCIFCPSSAPFPQKQYIFINLPLQALLRQSYHHHCLFQFIYHSWSLFFMYFIETSYQGQETEI